MTLQEKLLANKEKIQKLFKEAGKNNNILEIIKKAQERKAQQEDVPRISKD